MIHRTTAPIFAAFAILGAGVLSPACRADFYFDKPTAESDAGTADDAAVDERDAQVTRGECSRSADCVAPRPDSGAEGETRHVCDVARSLCVECLATSDCGPRRACDTNTKRCVDACGEGLEVCTRAGFICDEARGRCIGCLRRSDCTNDPAGSDCDMELGQCVNCDSNADCPRDKPVCDRRAGVCVNCLMATDCASGVCDPATHACAR